MMQQSTSSVERSVNGNYAYSAFTRNFKSRLKHILMGYKCASAIQRPRYDDIGCVKNCVLLLQ